MRVVLAKVQHAVARHEMAQPGERWGVAVSGGPDSIALLDVLAELAAMLQLRLGVVHFNHRLRGEESDADEAFVRDRADALGLPFDCESADIAEGENLEAAARQARYGFFERLLAAGAYDRIATGHTRSDQAETVLFRVLRGTGLAGLAGVRPVREPGLVRPLIHVSRCEVLEWLQERNISCRQDSSNLDVRFSRNRLRRDLLPQLASEWNPQVEQALARLGEQAAAEETYWDRIVDEALAKLQLRTSGESVEIDCATARQLEAAVLNRCLDRLARQAKAPGRQMDAAALEQLRAVLDPAGPSEAHLPGLWARRSCDVLQLLRPDSVPQPGAAASASPPGDLEAPDGRSRVLLQLLRQYDGNGGYNNGDRSLLDWDKLPYPLYLRAWKPGDSLAGSRLGDVRLLREMFRRSGVPAWDRERWPVLAATAEGTDKKEDVVVWSRGFGAAKAFTASSSTVTALEVREIAVDGREIRRIEDWSRGVYNSEGFSVRTSCKEQEL